MARVEDDVVLGERYRLLRRVAAGGMGSVWKAEDLLLHRWVAVKLLSDGLAADDRFVERFRREARAAAGLSHPNVAGVFDYGEDGVPYIVMKLIDGETLGSRLRREGRLDPAEAVRIVETIAGALQAAHDAGIVHRDVKPGNVMLTPSGEVKVLDFGIAAAGTESALTATGSTIGTAAYLSPEQAGGGRVTAASDVYALGVVLFEMLAGRPPFSGTPVAVAAAHVSTDPERLEDLVPSVPRHVARACHRALSKDPAARPPSAAAFAAMLASPAAISAFDHESGPGSRVVTAPTSEQTAVIPPLARTETLAPSAGTAILPSAGDVSALALAATRRRRDVFLVLLAAALAAALIVGLVLAGVGGGGALPTSPSTVTVPHVVGMSVAAAEQALRSRGMKVAGTPSAPGTAGVVVSTHPTVGASVLVGTAVTLYVGAGTQPERHGHKKGKGH